MAHTHVVSLSTERKRALQLVLAGIWLLDALLQYQPAMFTPSFARSLAATAPANPGFLARPIIWDAALVQHHVVALNAIFATIQLLLGLGIAFRPTARLALAVSIAWSLAVWWLGEGFGGVLNGTANPFTGAPGAVILYALLAALLWPGARRESIEAFGMKGAAAAPTALALWSMLWLSFAYFTMLPANRAPQALHDVLAGMGAGEPGWVAAIDRAAAALVNHQGMAVSITFSVAYILIAAGVWVPRPCAQAALVLGLAVSAVIWVTGEAFGMILAGGATDPSSGPLLALLAFTYWPARRPSLVPGSPVTAGNVTEGNLA